MAKTRDVRDACETGAATIADVRSWREYVGEGHDYRYMHGLGRVRGARWARWGPSTYQGGDFWNDDGTLRSLDQLRETWAANGIVATDTPIIFYCGTGWRSSLALLIGLSLGMKCRNYDGGWLAWAHTDVDAANNPCHSGHPAEERSPCLLR